MSLLIDLDKIYEEKELSPVCDKLKRIIEVGIKYAICRHCEEGSCVKSCPQDAIKKLGENLVRSTFLCTSCKTCIFACPFGVNLDEIIEYKMPKFYERLSDLEIKQLSECPYVEIGEFVDSEEIMRIGENIFVKSLNWKKQLGLK